MTPDGLLWLVVFGYLSGAVFSLPGRHPVARFLVAAGGAIAALASLALACAVLAGARGPVLSLGWFALAPFALRLDPLGAFFLLVVAVVGLASSIYGFGYTRGSRPSSLRVSGVSLNLLLLALSLQVMADNPLTFLILWESMSLAACALVLSDPGQPGAVSAANWYLGVTHAGFAALAAMFFVLAGGDLAASFAQIRAASLSAGARDAVFVCALVGFGTKAGLIPVHVWLPRAHPVAPSHGSAVMSGVVLKMGVYGMVRVLFDLGGAGAVPVAPWWGIVVLVLGTLSALFGVLYALMQHDLKRLLAYHSIENVGIIYMGLGASLLFLAYHLPVLAALALVAALFHTLNHACFKGLLFLGAGAVVHATHTRNIEAMGGLITRMPVTAFTFLVGSAAISALPPLNGFASEWLLFQSMLGGVRIPVPAVALLMPIGVGLLALTGGLAAACFVKAFGITFLAIPRSTEAESAVEAPRSMLAAMLVLAGACAALGLAAFAVVAQLAAVASGLPGFTDAGALRSAGAPFVTVMPTGLGQMSPPAIALGLVAVALVVVAALRAFAPRFRLRREETWGCGRLVQTPRMQYTATAFAQPLRRVFAELYRPDEDLTVEVHPDSKYFIRGITYESEVRPFVERLIYAPSVALVRRVARAVRGVQAGSIHLYLVYVCIALVALLLAARWLP